MTTSIKDTRGYVLLYDMSLALDAYREHVLYRIYMSKVQFLYHSTVNNQDWLMMLDSLKRATVLNARLSKLDGTEARKVMPYHMKLHATYEETHAIHKAAALVLVRYAHEARRLYEHKGDSN